MSYVLLANVTDNIVGQPIQLDRSSNWTINCDGATGMSADFGDGELLIQIANSATAEAWNTITYNGAQLKITDFTPYSTNMLGKNIWVRAVLQNATTPALTSVMIF